MARMTIAQLREKEVERLARYKTDEPTEDDIKEARRCMNSFYRLCGIDERLLYLENDARFCDKPYTKRLDEKRDKWHKRLDKQFHDLYGLNLVYCGYCPSIVVKYPDSSVSGDKITRWFYQ